MVVGTMFRPGWTTAQNTNRTWSDSSENRCLSCWKQAYAFGISGGLYDQTKPRLSDSDVSLPMCQLHDNKRWNANCYG
jgi:hypothetical protein